MVKKTRKAVKENEKIPAINGIVSNCTRLNVRKEPVANSEVLLIIKSGTKVVIDNDYSNDYFFKVMTNSGVEGFCNKKFIAVC